LLSLDSAFENKTIVSFYSYKHGHDRSWKRTLYDILLTNWWVSTKILRIHNTSYDLITSLIALARRWTQRQ